MKKDTQVTHIITPKVNQQYKLHIIELVINTFPDCIKIPI